MATAARAKFIYIVRMDVEPDKEADFNRIYDNEHIPGLLKVPGVISAARYKTSVEGVPKYLAIYELESPDIPDSEAFKNAANTGEWPDKVRPYTLNRSFVIYKLIYPE